MCTVFFFHQNNEMNETYDFEAWDGYDETVPCVGDEVDLFNLNGRKIGTYTVVSRKINYHGTVVIKVQ